MGAVIPQTHHEVLAPGAYRAKVGAVAVEEGMFGPQVALRFDLLDDGAAGSSSAHRSVQAWAKAKLSGGKRPSKLYAWTSALLFAGRALPAAYDLDTDALLGREALALIEVIEKEGLSYNRVVQLFPLQPAVQPAAQPAAQPDSPAADGPAVDAPAVDAPAWLGGWANGTDLPY